jgi:hypothetical protein
MVLTHSNVSSDNPRSADDQQERLDRAVENPQRPYASHVRTAEMKIWSDPYGDVGRLTEMISPPVEVRAPR